MLLRVNCLILIIYIDFGYLIKTSDKAINIHFPVGKLRNIERSNTKCNCDRMKTCKVVIQNYSVIDQLSSV